MQLDEDAAHQLLQRSFLLGISRQTMPLDQVFGGSLAPELPKVHLKALALAGQRLRFRRPARGETLSTELAVSDPREIINDAARRSLLRFLTAKEANANDIAAMAVADMLERRKLRLHPFDMPKVDGFILAQLEKLGASARHFVAEKSSNTVEKPAYFEPDALDETNWHLTTPAASASFLQRVRAADKAAGLTLLEQHFAGFSAETRLRLLQVLSFGLSVQDQPFLDSLDKDRAPKVRELAKTMLGQLPGTPDFVARIANVLTYIKRSKTGLLRRKDVLTLAAPAIAHQGWAFPVFMGVELDALARGLGMNVETMVEAAFTDPTFLETLMYLASAALRFDLVSTMVANAPQDAWFATALRSESLPQIFDNPVNTLNWVEVAVQPQLWTQMPQGGALPQLYRVTRQPLPRAKAEAALKAKYWRDYLDKDVEKNPYMANELLLALAALIPAPLRALLKQQLEPVSAAPRAIRLLEILHLLETGSPL